MPLRKQTNTSSAVETVLTFTLIAVLWFAGCTLGDYQRRDRDEACRTYGEYCQDLAPGDGPIFNRRAQ